MNPFDSAWDFFKAADRLSIADPSASKGSSGGHLQPYDKALGEKADEIDRKKQSDKKYLAEMTSAAPDSPPPPAEGDPRTEEIYEDLPDEAFPQGPPQAGPKSRGNPFTRSEPFDAAWALLKQWDDTDWTGEQHQPPADDWADVQWPDTPNEHGLITPTMPEGHFTQFVNPPPMPKRFPERAPLSPLSPKGEEFHFRPDGSLAREYAQLMLRDHPPSLIPHDELYARFLAQRQGATPSTGAIGQP